MIIIKRKAFILPYSQIWFAKDIPTSSIWNISTYKQSQFTGNRLGFTKKEFKTTEIDLSQPIEQIFKNFSNTVKNEIRRVQQEQVVINIEKNLELFLEFFNKFAMEKGINAISIDQLTSHRNNNFLSFAISSEEIISAHYYLVDIQSSRARLLYSASARFSDSDNRNFIGRSNKLLHFEDLKYFKEIGIKTFDFGGITIPAITKEQIGINKFKESFGGYQKSYFEYNSLLYNIISHFN